MNTFLQNLTTLGTQLISISLTLICLLQCNQLSAQVDSHEVVIYINEVRLVGDTSFLHQIGFKKKQEYKEVDETTIGLDSTHYYILDSLDISYTVRRESKHLNGITLKCNACLHINQYRVFKGQMFLNLFHEFSSGFVKSNKLKKFEQIEKYLDSWTSINLQIPIGEEHLSPFDFGLIHFSLKKGQIEEIRIQYMLE